MIEFCLKAHSGLLTPQKLLLPTFFFAADVQNVSMSSLTPFNWLTSVTSPVSLTSSLVALKAEPSPSMRWMSSDRTPSEGLGRTLSLQRARGSNTGSLQPEWIRKGSADFQVIRKTQIFQNEQTKTQKLHATLPPRLLVCRIRSAAAVRALWLVGG